MKRNWIYGLTLVMLVILISPIQAASSFTDISKHWAKDSILRLASLGYVSGFPNGIFKPDNDMTRAEFTTILINCMGVSKSSDTTSSFIDVKNNWAKGYINAAVKKGVLIPSEYPKGLNPDGAIKRSEVAAMLVRALGQQPDNGTVPPFEDKADILKSDYRGYIKKAFDLGLMSGYSGGKFVPFGNMTRGQVCTVMSKYLDKKGGPAPTTTTPTSTVISGDVQTLAIGDQSYQLSRNPIIFRMGTKDINVTTISVTQNSMLVNGLYTIKLEVSQDNPDIVVNNLDYKVSRYSLSGTKLIAYPESYSIYSLEEDGHKYYGYYTSLYINGAYGEYYLSDMQIIDANTVKIGGTKYFIGKDRLTIGSGENSYDIIGIQLNQDNNYLRLKESTSVIKEGLHLSDFAAIFNGDSTIDLADITKVSFVINGSLYSLSDVTIDANGSFVVGNETFGSSQVVMIIDEANYKISSLENHQDKFIIYCKESDSIEWVIVNDEYRSADDIKIQKDGTIYSMNKAQVVGDDLIQIGGKRYTIDSTFRCLMDNKYYDIDSVTFNSKKNATVLEVSESDSSYLPTQTEFALFVNDTRIQDGTDRTVKIKIGTNWVSLDDLLIPDPAHFTYKNSQYDTIGSLIRINSTEYIVTDTSWHGKTQVLDLYLE